MARKHVRTIITTAFESTEPSTHFHHWFWYSPITYTLESTQTNGSTHSDALTHIQWNALTLPIDTNTPVKNVLRKIFYFSFQKNNDIVSVAFDVTDDTKQHTVQQSKPVRKKNKRSGLTVEWKGFPRKWVAIRQNKFTSFVRWCCCCYFILFFPFSLYFVVRCCCYCHFHHHHFLLLLHSFRLAHIHT